jgi:protein AaeX
MTLGELNLFGVYFAPLVRDLALAALAYAPLRWFCAWSGLLALVWHVALFELCLFIFALAFVVYVR